MPDQHLQANPWGLADWFNSQTRIEADFAKFFAERADDYDAQRIDARAPAEMSPTVNARMRNPERLLRCN